MQMHHLTPFNILLSIMQPMAKIFEGPYASIFNNRGINAYTSAIDNSGNTYIAGSTIRHLHNPSGDTLWCKYTKKKWQA